MPGHDGRAYVEGYEAARSYLEARRLDPESAECREQERKLRALQLGDSLYPPDVSDASYARGFQDYAFLIGQHCKLILRDLGFRFGDEEREHEARERREAHARRTTLGVVKADRLKRGVAADHGPDLTFAKPRAHEQ